jgi:hypothetical protein
LAAFARWLSRKIVIDRSERRTCHSTKWSVETERRGNAGFRADETLGF